MSTFAYLYSAFVGAVGAKAYLVKGSLPSLMGSGAFALVIAALEALAPRALPGAAHPSSFAQALVAATTGYMMYKRVLKEPSSSIEVPVLCAASFAMALFFTSRAVPLFGKAKQ